MRVCIWAVVLVAPALAGLGFENELQFHASPDTHTDLTAAHLAGIPHGQPVPREGDRVATHIVHDPISGASMTVIGRKSDLADGDYVSVQLSFPAAVNKTAHDLQAQWLGVFGPSGINASLTTPIRYTLPGVDAAYAVTGSATIRFRMLNMRVPVDIVFFDNCKIPPYYYKYRGIDSCTATMRVVNFTFADYDVPLRPAVLRDPSPTTTRIAWTTATMVPGAVLQYWPVDASNNPTASPVSVTPASAKPYTADDLCQAPAKTYGYFDPGVRHVATLQDMVPGQVYRYTLGDDAGRVSEAYRFKMPVAPSASATASLLVFADLGRAPQDGSLTWDDYGRPALNTSKWMAVDLDNGVGEDGIFHVGDISYAVGFLPIWDIYGEMMTRVVARTAYSLNFGNHEADNPADSTPEGRVVTLYNGTDSGGECGVVTNGWYPMPWSSIDEPWFSYNVGPVHVVAMATESDFRTGSPQWLWIKQDLEAVDRSVTPWILFGGHRPMYIDSTYGVKWPSDLVVGQLLIDHVEPLLIQNNVDVAVWGHNHVVQRMCKLHNKQCVEHSTGGSHMYTKGGGGVVHLVIGAAGAAFSYNVNNPPLEMTEFTAYVFGHSRMRFEGADRMTWEWINNADGSVLDAMEIVKQSPAPQGLAPAAIGGIVAASVVVAGALAAVVWGRRASVAAAGTASETAALRKAGPGDALSSPFASMTDTVA